MARAACACRAASDRGRDRARRTAPSTMRSRPKPTHARVRDAAARGRDPERDRQVVEVAVARDDRGRLLVARDGRDELELERALALVRGEHRAGATEERIVGDDGFDRRARGRPSSAATASSQSSRNASALSGVPTCTNSCMWNACMRAGSSDGSCRKQVPSTSNSRPPSGSSPVEHRVERVARRRAAARDRSARGRPTSRRRRRASRSSAACSRVAAVEPVDRADEIGERAQVVGAHERSRGNTAGKRYTSGSSTAPGFGDEAVEALEGRDEARRLGRRRP